MDPFGNVPAFLSVLRPVEHKRCRWVIAREFVIALGFLIAFLFGGQYLLAAITARMVLGGVAEFYGL
jgi:multiple antibiotic resistance protein